MTINIEQVRQFIINSSPESKIYVGADSEQYKIAGKWMVDYYTVCVVHIDGHRGCKVFGEKTSERDYTQDKRKPQYRLMQEVYKASELYLKIADVIGDRHCEVHLDLNPSKKHVSNMIVDQAVGYIRGTCNVIPMIKPHSWAASHCADRFLRIGAR
jgi:predicted RNase H-related nuclease YkuK (DUF458 family)